MENEIEKPDCFYIAEGHLSGCSSTSFDKEGFLSNTEVDETLIESLVGGYLEIEDHEDGLSYFEALVTVSEERIGSGFKTHTVKRHTLHIEAVNDESDTLKFTIDNVDTKDFDALIERYNGVISAFDENRQHSLCSAFATALQYC